MNLVELKISNFMRVSCLRIRPDGALVTIAGKNSSGKTSTLRSIWCLLAGKAAAPPVPIREGQEECKLYGDFGSLKVTRTFKKTEDGDVTMSLHVTNADGSAVRSKPQAMLDSLLGAYAFDPLSFARAPAKTQFDTLKKLVPGIDFDKMAEIRKDYFDKRTEANRKAKEFRTLAERVTLPPGPCPKAIDVTAQLAALADANKHNASILPEKQKRAQYGTDLRSQRQAAIEKRVRAADLRAQAEQLEQAADAIDLDVEGQEKIIAALPSIPEPIDVAPINATIAAAEQVKATRTLHENRRRNEDEAERWDGESESLSSLIDELDRKKVEAISAAKMPVDGLSFGDGEILLNGAPFSQAGTAEKIRASVAIGMSMNPEMKLMTIDEASELDSESTKIIADMAEVGGWQVWCARVDESGQNGFVMQDGHLAEQANG
jgi:hypothetical protein